MSIADRVRMSWEEETTTYGTMEGGTLQDLRFTSESLSAAIQTVSSAQIRSDRNVAELLRTDMNVAGDLNFELSYGSYDDFFAMAFGASAWTASSELVAADGNVGITFTAATGNIEATGAFASGVAAGDWIQVNNLTSSLAAMNGKCYKVLEVTDNDNIIVAGAEAIVGGTQAADASSANGVIIRGAYIENGTAERFFSIEKHYTDISGGTPYAQLTGLMIDTMALNIVADGIVTGTFGLLGKTETLAASSGGGGYSAVNTNPVMTGVSDVLAVLTGTPAVNSDNTLEVTNATINLANNLRARKVVGLLGPKSYGPGKSAWSGTMQAYFEDQQEADDFLAFTETGVALLMDDPASGSTYSLGNRYVIDLPSARFSSGPRNASGENTDVMLDLAFTAYYNSTIANTASMWRFPAA